jgi:hypothetical protein
MAARLAWGMRWRLSVLWALEWGISGAILTYLPLYFTDNGLSFDELGTLLAAVSALGLWVAPFVVGQVCDRWLASEKYLAISHFCGGLLLVAIPIATKMHNETGENLAAIQILVGLYAVAYFPTVPLASSLTFRHLDDPDAQFGKVRIWGTVGWVLAGLSLSLWLRRTDAYEWVVLQFPEWQSTLQELRTTLSWVVEPTSSDCFRIAAILSFALSSFCVFLPSTPPTRSRRGTIAPLQALSMFRDPTFTLLITISFFLAIVIPFYTMGVPKLLTQSGFDADWIPAVMTIGQISEFPALLLLPFCLKRLGLKVTFALGLWAWFARYLFFAVNGPVWLIVSGISLHGVCHVFLIIVNQLYIDSHSRSDVRASAQNLFAFITAGIGMPLGLWLSGKLGQWSIDPTTGLTNHQLLFSAPALLILVLVTVFWKLFHPSQVSDLESG